jgi:allantoin racemase
MKRRILVIVPLFITSTDAESIRNDLSKCAWQGTTVDVVGNKGNIAVNSRSEADIAANEFVSSAIHAEKNGYDAVISYCYADVGVEAAREEVNIDVIGPLETSAIIANLLGTKFSAITIETAIAFMQPRLKVLGLDANYVSTRGISLSKYFVFSADAESARITQDSLEEECKKALSDGADALILACTGFPPAEKLKEEINVPLVESNVTVKIAEILTDLRSISHMQSDASTESSKNQSKKPDLRIKILVPTSSNDQISEITGLRDFIGPDTETSIVRFKDGPKTIESAYDVASVAPFIVTESSTAQAEGFHAVVIASSLDPALASAREVSSIPVVGSGETSMMLACEYGDFSILTENTKTLKLRQRIVRKLGIAPKIVSIRCSDEDPKSSDIGLLEEIEAEMKNGADAIVLDRSNSMELLKRFQSELRIPLITPVPAAIKMAAALQSLSLTQSKRAYPRPVLPPYHVQRLKKLRSAPKDKNRFLYKKE